MYNGHKSYAYWNVSLWLLNNEEYYRTMMKCIRIKRTKDQAARAPLEMLPEKTPDGVRYSFSTVRAAMAGL